MRILRLFAGLLVGILGACASGGYGPTPASPGLPPRLASAPEEPPGISGVYSPCGITVVGNDGDLHFRIELAGNKVGLRHGAENDIYVVDGLLVRTIVTRADAIGSAYATGVDLLRAHATWQSTVLSNAMGRQARPEELEILAADNMPAALIWWLPGTEAGEGAGAQRPDSAAASPADPAGSSEPNRPTGLLFASAAFGARVLAMSLQGMHGEQRAELAARAKAWLATLVTSPRAISVQQTKAGIQAAILAGQTCPGRANAILEELPPPTGSPISVDRGLRFDGLSEQDKAQALVLAQANGGVARRQSASGVQYTNYVCRFEYLLPSGWQEYAVQDFNGHGCSINLTTAEVTESRLAKPVSNAVAIVAAAAAPDLDRETLHQRMLFTLKNSRARITRVTPSLLDGAAEDHFQSERDGQALEGDLITFQRGDLLYQILFTATPGSYNAGKAGFLRFLNNARWGMVEGK